jgi:hypothetical protein
VVWARTFTAFGWQSRAQYRCSAVDLDGLSSGSLLKKYIDGNRKNIHTRFNRESHPYRETQAPERDGKGYDRLDRSIKKNALIFFAISDASVSLDEGHDFALSGCVMLDIFGSGAEVCVSRQHLDISQAAADLADPSRCTGHERPPAAMRGAADHPEPGIQPMKPYSDRRRRQAVVALTVDDRPIWMCPDASLSMESHERSL